MSTERNDAPPRGRPPSGSGRFTDVAPSALLVAGVGAILVAAYVLQAEPLPERREPVTRIAPPPEPVVAVPPSEERHEPPQALRTLADRAGADAARLGATGRPFTAQLIVACKPDTVARMIAAAQGAESLFVLPAEVDGQACFRICWGAYASAKEAASARDLPQALRAGGAIVAAETARVAP